MLKADDFRTDRKEISGWPVTVTSYRIGGTFYCRVDNVDPGATIARTEGDSYEEAVEGALTKAEIRLMSKTL